MSGAFSVQFESSTINFFREINCVTLYLNMSNKKIYSLVICFNEDTDVIEWVEERLEREDALPDDMFETQTIEELEEELEDLPKITIIGEA